MDYRACGRGCRYRERHLETCTGQAAGRAQGYGVEPCRGCVAARTVPGTNLCTRCLRRLREVLAAAPELCAHIRSMIAPVRSGWHFDRDRGGRRPRPGAPAPMSVDLLDAGDEVIQILAGWAEAFGDDPGPYAEVRNGFPSSTTPEGAFTVAKWASDYLVLNLERIAGDTAAVMFTRHVLDFPPDPADWTIRKALARFPLEQEGSWSRMPCPSARCGMRTVWVTPPRRSGDATRHTCRSCGWSPPAGEEESWSEYFEMSNTAAISGS
jgi:hypothetical protein